MTVCCWKGQKQRLGAASHTFRANRTLVRDSRRQAFTFTDETALQSTSASMMLWTLIRRSKGEAVLARTRAGQNPWHPVPSPAGTSRRPPAEATAYAHVGDDLCLRCGAPIAGPVGSKPSSTSRCGGSGTRHARTPTPALGASVARPSCRRWCSRSRHPSSDRQPPAIVMRGAPLNAPPRAALALLFGVAVRGAPDACAARPAQTERSSPRGREPSEVRKAGPG
jgi:hypothetical protein